MINIQQFGKRDDPTQLLISSAYISLLCLETTTHAGSRPLLFRLVDLTAIARSTLGVEGADNVTSLAPSICSLPFSIPMESRTPTFTSKHARIRYLLSATLIGQRSRKPVTVRTTVDVRILNDHESVSLRSTTIMAPLSITAETAAAASGQRGYLKATASITRSVWHGGFHIPICLRIANMSSEDVCRISLAVCRSIHYRDLDHVGAEQKHHRTCDVDRKQWPQKSSRVDLHPGRTRMYRFALSAPPSTEATVIDAEAFDVGYAIEVLVRTAQGTRLSIELPIYLLPVAPCTAPSLTTFQGEREALERNLQFAPAYEQPNGRENSHSTTRNTKICSVRNESHEPVDIAMGQEMRLRGRTTPPTNTSVPLKSGQARKKSLLARLSGKAALSISAPILQQRSALLGSPPGVLRAAPVLSMPENDGYLKLTPQALCLSRQSHSRIGLEDIRPLGQVEAIGPGQTQNSELPSRMYRRPSRGDVDDGSQAMRKPSLHAAGWPITTSNRWI